MTGSVDPGDGLNTSGGPQVPLVPAALSGRINGLVRVEPSVAGEVTPLSRRGHLPLRGRAAPRDDDG